VRAADQDAGGLQLLDGEGEQLEVGAQSFEPVLGDIRCFQGVQVAGVEVDVEVLGGVVVEVDVDRLAGLVDEAAAAAVEHVVPAGEVGDGAVLGDLAGVGEGAGAGELVGVGAQAGADDREDPLLAREVAGEADEGPRVPRGREEAGLGEDVEGGDEVVRGGGGEVVQHGEQALDGVGQHGPEDTRGPREAGGGGGARVG
jgi:hypothetical protein